MLALGVVAVAVAGLVAWPAGAAQVTAWDGTNPFRCELQQAGFEPTGPDPGADPYCVEFDKRRQNITGLGIVDFPSTEPARVAAASDKCFYFQSDHWRSAVVQDDGSTKLYEWDGHYFFDKAKAEGGAWVTNFNVNGHTEDPARFPGMPPEYAQYMGPGTGGVVAKDSGVEPDPRCAERARREPEKIYATAEERAGQPARATSAECRRPTGGRVTSARLGPVAIGDTELRVRERIGRPSEVRRGFHRYCDDGGYLVGQASDRSGDLGTDDGEPTVMLVATRGAFRLKGAGPGVRARTLRRAFGRRLRRGGAVGRTAILRVRGRPVAFGVRARRVRFIAVYDRRAISGRRALRDYLRRALGE